MPKKSFKASNPALSFIGTASDTHTHTDEYTHTHTHIDIPASIPAPIGKPVKEPRSRRLQTLIKPSTHAALTVLSERRGSSVNDTINAILENFITGGGDI